MNYDNNNTGIISKNDKKDTDKHPDIKGQCEVDGVEYWVAGWVKERKDGTGKFYSLKFEPKEEQKKAAKPAKNTSFDDQNDDPF
jgi:hypothetical protein